MKRMIIHINNLIFKIVLLNTNISINVNNLGEIHLNELNDLRLKQDKMRKNFYMSRDWFYVVLAFKDNEQK